MSHDSDSKVRTIPELRRLVAGAQEAGRKVVFGNGCFDLVHVGHIRYLEGAKALGDLLVVGINSDASVRALKGPGRPLLPQEERAEIIGSLACVDHIVIIEELTVERLLLALKPDIHAKGTDYTSETVPERDTVRGYGGRVAIVGDPKVHSSRDMIEIILAKMDRWPSRAEY